MRKLRKESLGTKPGNLRKQGAILFNATQKKKKKADCGKIYQTTQTL